MSHPTLDPNLDDDQYRLDMSAQLGDLKRTVHEEYAGGPGIGARTLENGRRIAESSAQRPAPGGIAGIIREGATQGRELVTLPASGFGKALLLFVFVILLALVLMWDGKGINITIGGTTVEKQTVQEQDVGQMKVTSPDTSPGNPAASTCPRRR